MRCAGRYSNFAKVERESGRGRDELKRRSRTSMQCLLTLLLLVGTAKYAKNSIGNTTDETWSLGDNSVNLLRNDDWLWYYCVLFSDKKNEEEGKKYRRAIVSRSSGHTGKRLIVFGERDTKKKNKRCVRSRGLRSGNGCDVRKEREMRSSCWGNTCVIEIGCIS